MGQMDYQLGVADETTYGTAVTPTRFFEYDEEGIEETEGRTEGNPLRTSPGGVARSDRFTPYFSGAAGNLSMAVLTKGFGYWLKHMLGAVATSGPTDSTYTHTGTVAETFGKSLTLQVNRMFNPSGTNQAFTYRGGKVTGFTLSNAVDENLMLELALDFMQVDTAAALAAASYPTAMDNLTWAGGYVQIAGTNYDIDEISIEWDAGLNVERRQLRANTDKKEPTAENARAGTVSLTADFDSLAQRARAHAVTKSGALGSLNAFWVGPNLLGATTYPSLQVSIPALRFDSWKASTGGQEGLKQELSGLARYDGTNSPLSIVYKSGDTTP